MNVQDIDYVHYELTLGKCNWSLKTWLLLNTDIKQLGKLYNISNLDSIGEFYKHVNHKIYTPDGLMYTTIRTHMILAIQSELTHVVKKLLNQPVIIDNFMLCVAIRFKNINIWLLFMSRIKVNINQCMLYASQYGNMEVIQSMLDNGATNHNECVKHVAKQGDTNLVQLFLDNGANNYIDIMIIADKHGHENVIKLVLPICWSLYDNNYFFNVRETEWLYELTILYGNVEAMLSKHKIDMGVALCIAKHHKRKHVVDLIEQKIIT